MGSISGVTHPACHQVDPWAHVRGVVAKSKTSFRWGMRILPAERRHAMYAIYAFCREVDDVADKPGDLEVKKKQLSAWREEIERLYAGQPQWPTTRALLDPVQRYHLPRQEFLNVVDGVETDARLAVRMQRLDDLLAYCRKVAGAVGMLSIHVFGVPEHPGPRIAETLGNAMQLTNILRDLKDDVAIQRFYVPLELVARQGSATSSRQSIFKDPRFPPACAELARLARDCFAEADALIGGLGSRRMRPAEVMMAIYRETLRRLERRGWDNVDGAIRLSGTRKTWLALRHGLL